MIKTRLKIFTIITIVLFITYHIISFFSTFHVFAAGSYPYAESYFFNYPEEKVIDTLEKLKLKNADLKDKYPGDFWHDIYFNLGDKRIQTWTRSFSKNETSFALVAVYKNRETGWQLVNQDLGLFRNIMLKREFEKEIIERLKIELAK